MFPSKIVSSSFESIRKQAKKLARLAAAGDADALARVRAQLTVPALPLSLRNAQLVLAREYGFGGWRDLRAAVLRREDKSPEWAAAEAERAIHDNNADRLTELVRDYPALLAWRSDAGESLLSLATGSFGDSGDPVREETFTRVACAELLLNAGATVEPAIWEAAIHARAKGVLQLLSRRGVLPRRLHVLAALGDIEGVRDLVGSGNPADVTQAFLCACRFHHKQVAGLLLDRCIELDSALGEHVEEWRGRSAFIDYLAEHEPYGSPWQTVIMNELQAAMHNNDIEALDRWLRQEPGLALKVELIEKAAYNDRGPCIARLIESAPALQSMHPPSSALVYALEYGNAHLVPLLTRIWPLPNDLCHAAGTGDFARVKSWFDEAGHPRLGSLSQHYPTNNPGVLRNLRWFPPNAQHVLDAALAWASMNRQFEIASFLLNHGANINTDWGTHEPASILHQCVCLGKYETAQFLINRGIDLTIRDYRWNATAEGWERHAFNDAKMAELLANANRKRKNP